MPLSVSQPVFGLESVETAVIPPWKIMKILSHRLKNYENRLFRLNQSIHTSDKNLLSSSLLVPFYQFSKQNSEVKNVHNSLWSLTL